MKTRALAPVLVPAALYAASEYFFRYTFTRADRPDPWDVHGWNWILLDRAFFERPDRELLEITSRDGLRLRGWFYDQGAGVTVILCHGYRGGPEELSGIASELYRRGMNVLLIYQRAHGMSEGTFFTMGTKEKLDAADWAGAIAARKPDGRIALFGWSMGGNTVMGAAGESLPEHVKCAVEDCGYDNLRSQLLFSAQNSMPYLPLKRLFIGLLGVHCRLFKGFSIEDPRSLSLGRCRVPILFIHGTDDRVVPYANLARCFGACPSEKRSATYADAPHVGSCGFETERYFRELTDFIESNTQ